MQANEDRLSGRSRPTIFRPEIGRKVVPLIFLAPPDQLDRRVGELLSARPDARNPGCAAPPPKSADRIILCWTCRLFGQRGMRSFRRAASEASSSARGPMLPLCRRRAHGCVFIISMVAWRPGNGRRICRSSSWRARDPPDGRRRLRSPLFVRGGQPLTQCWSMVALGDRAASWLIQGDREA